MELEVIRMVAAALAHDTIGVNAKLPGVPRDVGDEQPSDVTIADSTRDGWVARRKVASGSNAVLPAIAVSVFRPAELDGEIGTIIRDGTFDVLLEHVVRNSDTALATQDGLYRMRAAMRTLGEFHKPIYASTLRTRNGVLLLACTKLHEVSTWSEREDAVVTAALIVSYSVRDSQPLS